MTTPDSGSESTFIRGMAIFSAVVTAAAYLIGLLNVGLAVSEVGAGADSTPMSECRNTPHRPAGETVLKHEVRFIPLQVMCRTTDGRVFASQVVPSWLNPALAVSLAGTVVFTAGAFVQTNRRASVSLARSE